MRTMWNAAIWKYSPNRAVCGATHGQRQDPILIVQTQVSPLDDRLTARPAITGVMSPALHDVLDEGSIGNSWAP